VKYGNRVKLDEPTQPRQLRYENQMYKLSLSVATLANCSKAPGNVAISLLVCRQWWRKVEDPVFGSNPRWSFNKR